MVYKEERDLSTLLVELLVGDGSIGGPPGKEASNVRLTNTQSGFLETSKP